METDEKPLLDWDRVELDYRTGLHSNATLAEKYGISENVITKAAQSRCWTKEMLTPSDEATVLAIAETPRFPIDSLFSPDDVKRKVLMTAGQVVKVHREEIAKLRGITTEITDRLLGFLEATSGEQGDITELDEEGKEQISNKNKAVPKFLVIAGKDSAADLLEKVSRIMVRTTELERQAYGLDSMTIIPNEEEENQVSRDIKSLAERIRQITSDKAQKVKPKKNVDSGQDNPKASENPTTRA